MGKSSALLTAAVSGLFILAIAVFVGGFAGPRALRFESESVTLRVTEGNPVGLEVDGTYVVGNTGYLPVSLAIRFPFLLGPEVAANTVEKVELDGAPIPWTMTDGEARFEIHVPAAGRTTLKVLYRQFLRERVARYVVKTIRDWGYPVGEARFAVELPAGCRLATATPPFDVKTGVGVARQYWPDRDLEVTWACAPPPSPAPARTAPQGATP